jgi:lambda repressor-like predicted transcriptional regulator
MLMQHTDFSRGGQFYVEPFSASPKLVGLDALQITASRTECPAIRIICGFSRIQRITFAFKVRIILMEVKIAIVMNRMMKEKKLSIKELSRLSGVPSSTLHEWLNLRIPKSPVQVKKVANVLNVSLDHLLFDEQEALKPVPIQDLMTDDTVSGVFEITIKRVKEKK